MIDPHKDMDWIWVIVTQDKGEETLYGQIDEEHGESFIPVFTGKDDALMVLGRLPRKKNYSYQIQAMHYGEVSQAAKENGFKLFFLANDGEILEKISFDNG
jgi:hypothetical protein